MIFVLGLTHSLSAISIRNQVVILLIQSEIRIPKSKIETQSEIRNLKSEIH
jgi:hypothetical protein